MRVSLIIIKKTTWTPLDVITKQLSITTVTSTNVHLWGHVMITRPDTQSLRKNRSTEGTLLPYLLTEFTRTCHTTQNKHSQCHNGMYKHGLDRLIRLPEWPETATAQAFYNCIRHHPAINSLRQMLLTVYSSSGSTSARAYSRGQMTPHCTWFNGRPGGGGSVQRRGNDRTSTITAWELNLNSRKWSPICPRNKRGSLSTGYY